MAISPLDIYERAYRLQYEKNDIAAAVELYKQIIGEFPDSNECGYAAVQLEKIQATEIIDKLEAPRSGGGAIGILALVVSVVAILAALGIGAFLYVNNTRTAEINSVLMRSLGLLATDQADEALSRLHDIQQKYPSNTDIRAVILSIQTRKTPVAVVPPPPRAASDSAIDSPPVAAAAVPKASPAVVAVVPAPVALSHQQKSLSQQLLARPAASPTRPVKPISTGFRPTAAKKSSADDSISFFP